MVLDEEKGEPICLSCMPNSARLCINVIMLPDKSSEFKNDFSNTKGKQSKLWVGVVLGSCSMTMFDEQFLMR
jgi:hypothetical protein